MKGDRGSRQSGETFREWLDYWISWAIHNSILSKGEK